MPIYKYECQECGKINTFMHAYDEVRVDCEHCMEKDSLKRILARPIIQKNKNLNKKNSSVGEITKKFIEENREILNKQKEDYSNKDYDKS